MTNPWHRRKEWARTGTTGAPYSHPDYPEWGFSVRPTSNFNPVWHRAVARVSARIQFAALLKRQADVDYMPDAAAKTADAALMAEMVQAVAAESLIATWTVTDEKGKPMKPSAENVGKVFAEFPEIYEGVTLFANKSANYAALSAADKEGVTSGN